MSLKRSCFSTVVKSDLKRSWWTSFLATLFMLLVTTVPLLDYAKYDYYSSSYNFYYNLERRVMDRLTVNYFVGMALSVFLAIIVFSYLNNANSVSFFHGLPMTRNTLLSAHLFSSFVLVAIPAVVNTLVCFMAVNDGVKISWLLTGLGLYLVYSALLFAITLCVVMLTGSSIASAVFTTVVIFLPLFLASFFDELCSTYLFGYTSGNDIYNWLLEYVYIMPDLLKSPRVLVYIIGTVLLIAFAYFVYNKRHLENYGEVIAFPNLKGLFKVLFGICAGILGYFYFMAFWGVHSIVVMFAFGALGVVIAHMISNKSLSLKGSFKSFVVTMAVILLLFVTFKFDLFGFETRIPKLDDVEYIKLNNMSADTSEYVYDDFNGGRTVTRVEHFDPKFETEEDIQLIRKIHAEKIENRNFDGEGTHRLGYYQGLKIEYKLKNGSTMKRNYYLSIDEVNELMRPVYETDVYRKWQYPVLDGTEKKYLTVTVADKRTDSLYYDSAKVFSGNTPEAEKIVQALIKDRKDISFERTLGKKNGSYLSIELDYTVPCTDEHGNSCTADKNERYYIDNADRNVMAVLNEMGYFEDEGIMTYDHVVGVGVSIESVSIDGGTYYPDGYLEKYEMIDGRPQTVVEQYETVSAADIKDVDISMDGGVYKYYSVNDKPDEAKELYDWFVGYESYCPISEKVYADFLVTVHYKNSKEVARTIECTFDEIPSFLEELKKYAELDKHYYR